MDVDAELENAHKEPKPYEKLWIPDGNVVLATDTHLFKVHKSVLSMQSSVFRDMFELPTVGGTQTTFNGAGMVSETYEGVSVVKLAGDKGEDVVHLLRAVYERQYYRIDKDDTPLETVIALLLLSTKYDFKHIRRDVIAQISKHFPMTLADCDAMDEDDDETLLFGKEHDFSRFVLLKALHTANVDALLPSAYYTCADYVPQLLKKKANALEMECFAMLMAGKIELGENINELIANVPGELLTEAGVDECDDEIDALTLSENVNIYDMKYVEGTRVVGNCQGLCVTCKSNLIQLINARRQEIWEKVPAYFGFSVGWDVLRAQLEEILSSEE